MAIKDSDQLMNGTTFDNYHRDSVGVFTGFQQNTKGSNFDNLVKFFDMVTFTQIQNLDEVDRAHSIDLAHGMELDDWGDDLLIPRNQVDDDTYRFLLKSRLMARGSRGTINDLLRIAANLLGCDVKDIYMTKDRAWVDDQLQGEPNTLKIVDIPYDKVKNMFVLDRLASELEHAANGDTHIKFVNFSVPLNMSAYAGVAVSAHAEMDIDIPPYVEVHAPLGAKLSTGVGVSFALYFDI